MSVRENTQAKSTELVDVIQSLRDEVRVLRDAVDEFRELFAWVASNPEPNATLFEHLQRSDALPADDLVHESASAPDAIPHADQNSEPAHRESPPGRLL